MDRAKIKQILLANGFKEKEQADGSIDLNPYVYTAIEEILNAGSTSDWANIDIDKFPGFYPSAADTGRHNEYQYLNLMFDVKQNGRFKADRTGTGTYSVFGRQMRFDLSKGFPLLTSKKMHLRSIIHELLWFLKGDTNAKYLTDNDVTIWDEWAVTAEQADAQRELTLPERVDIAAVILNCKADTLWYKYFTAESAAGELYDDITEENEVALRVLLTNLNVPEYVGTGVQAGELGPIYGKQWRAWETPDGRLIDQISQVVETLKKNPTSRRIIVSGWNPADLPDESIPPSVNALQGKQALPPCHTMFQFYCEELTLAERNDYLLTQYNSDGTETTRHSQFKTFLADHITYPITQLDPESSKEIELWHDLMGTPKYRLSCQLYQRSADLFLGVPFNVASYALLTMMMAQCVNMIPGDFVHTFGDVHLYSNHLEQTERQLKNYPFNAPQLILNPSVTNLFDFKYEDFTLVGYRRMKVLRVR